MMNRRSNFLEAVEEVYVCIIRLVCKKWGKNCASFPTKNGKILTGVNYCFQQMVYVIFGYPGDRVNRAL